MSKIKDIKTTHVMPNELDKIPKNSDLILTTEIEKQSLRNYKIFVPKSHNRTYLYSNIIKKIEEKNKFGEVIVGVDPGKTIGLATLADDIVIQTAEYFTPLGVVKEIISIFFNIETDDFKIKIGHGGGEIREEITSRLNKIFQNKVDINVINERYTSKNQMQELRKVYSKHMAAAILIAKRGK